MVRSPVETHTDASDPELVRIESNPGVKTREDIRHLIPALGLKEYWYAALPDRKVKSKPVGVRICGEDLVFFRGGEGQVKALTSICPHRGGNLQEGDCHFKGTISCPYHGWTYDGGGNVVAVIPEGPDSKIPGNVTIRAYPTKTVKGLVFVWMGTTEPSPIERDVPPELFDEDVRVLLTEENWPIMWNVGLENGPDLHVPYVHRNALRSMMFPMPAMRTSLPRSRVVNGAAVVQERPAGGAPARTGSAWKQTYYEALGGAWPKHTRRNKWNWLFRWAAKRNAKKPRWTVEDEWENGTHLPGMFRSDHRTDRLTRFSVPVDEKLSHQIYIKAVRPKQWIGWLYERIHYKLYGRWMQVSNFSNQDLFAQRNLRYDTPEYFSHTDMHTILWRRVVAAAADNERVARKELQVKHTTR